MHKRTSHIITLIVGIIIGALGGILFTPVGGSSTRRLLSYQLKRLGEKIHTLVTDLAWFKHKKMATSMAKEAGQDLVDKTMQRAQALLEEVKMLSAQLESNQELE